MNAAPDRTALMRQKEADMRERLRRAAADIMVPGDESHSVDKVAKIRRVSESLLREELARLGWEPPKRVRQNNSRSRAKHLPRTRSDNQT